MTTALQIISNCHWGTGCRDHSEPISARARSQTASTGNRTASRQPDSQHLQCRNPLSYRAQAVAGASETSFDFPQAPVLITPGTWREVDGCVCAPQGFRAQGMHAGLRAASKKADLALIMADKPAAVAGVFTQNALCAAPVSYCKRVLSNSDTAQAVLVNAGQANAATGDQGAQDCTTSAEAVSQALSIPVDQVLLMSTGVIGRRMRVDALTQGVPELARTLGRSPEDGLHAAVAITTTDLVSKTAALETEIGGRTVRVGGMAKGSGMIHPNMATLLAAITTDAAVSPGLWRDILRKGAANSFNQISVDGDTSTNDTLLGLASGAAGNSLITDLASQEGQQLEAATTALLQGLAKSIAWDGEGATCLLEVRVTGAKDDTGARRIARSVTQSSLTKAAVFGHDPNWGRIACAAGYAGVHFDQYELDITMGSTELMRAGQPLPFDAAQASAYLKDTTAVHGTVNIDIAVGKGPGQGVAWGCDLSYDYVKINAEYTT